MARACRQIPPAAAASPRPAPLARTRRSSRLKEIADRVLWLEDGRFRAISEMATDPVCGMAVERQNTPHYRHDGQTYFFCSTACRDEFAATPADFLNPRTQAQAGDRQ